MEGREGSACKGGQRGPGGDWTLSGQRRDGGRGEHRLETRPPSSLPSLAPSPLSPFSTLSRTIQSLAPNSTRVLPPPLPAPLPSFVRILLYPPSHWVSHSLFARPLLVSFLLSPFRSLSHTNSQRAGLLVFCRVPPSLAIVFRLSHLAPSSCSDHPLRTR